MNDPYEYDVCVVGGLGRVGLPLSIVLADVGKQVAIYDINTEVAETVRRGKMPFLENGAEERLREVIGRNLHVFNDMSPLEKSRYIVIIIGTPVDSHLNPSFALFQGLIHDMAEHIRDDHHIILRSTIFPGTTRWLRNALREMGKATRVSFCPERIAEGRAMEELYTLPDIIGTFDDESYEDARGLIGSFSRRTIQTSPEEAELAKLFSNVWRYIRFAIANQFYTIAAENNIDYYRVHDAMTMDYPRCSDIPTAGFTAGPCLFKDTMQIGAFNNNNFFLGHAAMLVNEGLPNFIVQRLKRDHDLTRKTVGLLGMAFKGNTDDIRESLAYKLRHILQIEARRVLCTDALVSDPEFVSAEELIDLSDIVIVCAPHDEYAGLKIDGDTHLVDIWNYFGKGGLF